MIVAAKRMMNDEKTKTTALKLESNRGHEDGETRRVQEIAEYENAVSLNILFTIPHSLRQASVHPVGYQDRRSKLRKNMPVFKGSYLLKSATLMYTVYCWLV